MLYLQTKQMNRIGQNQLCRSACKSRKIVQHQEWAVSSRAQVIRTQTVKRSNDLGVTLSKSLLIRSHQHKRVTIWYCRGMLVVERATVDPTHWHPVKIRPRRILGRTNHLWPAAWSKTAIANWIHRTRDQGVEPTKHYRKHRIGLKIWRWRTCRPTRTRWTSRLAWVVARIES